MSNRRFAISTIFVLALLASITGACGRGSSRHQREPAHMLVTVEAVHGNSVPVITREDVMVYEGRVATK